MCWMNPENRLDTMYAYSPPFKERLEQSIMRIEKKGGSETVYNGCTTFESAVVESPSPDRVRVTLKIRNPRTVWKYGYDLQEGDTK